MKNIPSLSLKFQDKLDSLVNYMKIYNRTGPLYGNVVTGMEAVLPSGAYFTARQNTLEVSYLFRLTRSHRGGLYI